MTTPANRNALWATALLQELARSGVEHVCASPGSRSTPLALAAATQPGLKLHVHLDERSSAFFALGVAKASGKPAALICTSGTAAANYLPAIVEAAQARVPLVVLTADRPPELRGWGSAQTIDQVGLYGSYPRWAVDLPVPEATPAALAQLRAAACRAVGVALGPPRGVAHLNVPFREPLPPIPVPGDVPADLPEHLLEGRPEGQPWVTLPPPEAPSAEAVRALAQLLRSEPRGVLFVGPQDRPGLGAAASELAELLGWPVLAEAASSARFGTVSPATLAAPDLLARSEAFCRAHRPGLALRLGQAPTTRTLARLLDSAARTAVLDEPGAWTDPGHRAALRVEGEPERVLRAMTALLREAPPERDPSWLADFQRADALARTALATALAREERVTELGAAQALFEALPADATLFVSSSMPIRDLEAVAPATPRPVRVLANRGANGIDGVTSSALGAAAASGGRGALLIGDVAFVHDLGGLLGARGLSLTALVVNNDGGGIFHFLEAAAHVERARFEQLFGTPHGVGVAQAVAAFGGSHALAETPAALREALARALASPGLQVVEVRTEREENVRAHRRVFEAVGRALEGQPWPATS